MAFCSSCGTELTAGVGSCPKCGTAVPAGGATGGEAGGAPAPSALSRNVAGALCYALGLITGIIFLVLEPYKRDRFVKFHAFQSIMFNVASIVVTTVVSLVPFVG